MNEFIVTSSDFITESKAKLRDVYFIGKTIGEGGFGIVKQITHKVLGEVRAVKIIDKESFSDQEIQGFFKEVSILKCLDHPNILKLYEYYQDSSNYYLITEICTGGDLFDSISRLGSLSESMVSNYMKQILSVLVYCNDRNIVHRDLKLENFMLATAESNSLLKIVDFGIAEM
jgi:calcium-dependent protein kinase